LACAALWRRDRFRSLLLPLMLLSQPAGINTPVPAFAAESAGGLSSLAIVCNCRGATSRGANQGYLKPTQ
jgi:hypothetical protein